MLYPRWYLLVNLVVLVERADHYSAAVCTPDFERGARSGSRRYSRVEVSKPVKCEVVRVPDPHPPPKSKQKMDFYDE